MSATNVLTFPEIEAHAHCHECGRGLHTDRDMYDECATCGEAMCTECTRCGCGVFAIAMRLCRRLWRAVAGRYGCAVPGTADARQRNSLVDQTAAKLFSRWEPF
jgi:hypothetical protein